VINGFEKGQHKFQGMGPGFIPKNLDLNILDGCKMVYEEDAFPLARRLAREEGLFVGMSSGASIYAALEVARELGPGKVVVCLAADTAARYISTELFADS
jgi:cysteine synthase A